MGERTIIYTNPKQTRRPLIFLAETISILLWRVKLNAKTTQLNEIITEEHHSFKKQPLLSCEEAALPFVALHGTFRNLYIEISPPYLMETLMR